MISYSVCLLFAKVVRLGIWWPQHLLATYSWCMLLSILKYGLLFDQLALYFLLKSFFAHLQAVAAKFWTHSVKLTFRLFNFYPTQCYASMDTNYGPVLSVFVCACHKSVFYWKRWTDQAGFWHRGFSSSQSCAVFKGNSGIYKYEGSSLWNFVLNSGLRKFYSGISIVWNVLST